MESTMLFDIPEKAKYTIETFKAKLTPFFGKLCTVEIPKKNDSQPLSKYRTIIFDWFSLNENTQLQFISIYSIAKNKGSNNEWFFPFGIVPKKNFISWYKKGEKGEQFTAMPQNIDDRLIRTILMNQPENFLLCESIQGIIYVAEMNTGIKIADSLDALKIRNGKNIIDYSTIQ
jgi:hypothetical protein